MRELFSFLDSDVNLTIVLIGFVAVALAVSSFALVLVKGMGLYLSDVYSNFNARNKNNYRVREGYL